MCNREKPLQPSYPVFFSVKFQEVVENKTNEMFNTALFKAVITVLDLNQNFQDFKNYRILGIVFLSLATNFFSNTFYVYPMETYVPHKSTFFFTWNTGVDVCRTTVSKGVEITFLTIQVTSSWFFPCWWLGWTSNARLGCRAWTQKWNLFPIACNSQADA